MDAVVGYEVEGRVAVITLDRPEHGNAMTLQLCQEIFEVLDRADADDDVAAVVITGAGRNFCVGADLSEGFHHAGSPSPRFTAFAERFGEFDGVPRDAGGVITLRIAAMRTPVVAAINGAAVGGGASMVLPCDLRLVGESTRVGFVFGRRGMPTESASSWFLPRVVGITRAADWVFTGRLVPAPELVEGGLATRVVADEDLLEEALRTAREIATNTSQVATATSRQLLWGGLSTTGPWQAHRLESRAVFEFGAGADVAEGVASFLEKRDPDYPLRVPRDFPDFIPAWPDGSAQ